jgi:hypothetical protein
VPGSRARAGVRAIVPPNDAAKSGEAASSGRLAASMHVSHRSRATVEHMYRLSTFSAKRRDRADPREVPPCRSGAHEHECWKTCPVLDDLLRLRGERDATTSLARMAELTREIDEESARVGLALLRKQRRHSPADGSRARSVAAGKPTDLPDRVVSAGRMT